MLNNLFRQRKTNTQIHCFNVFLLALFLRTFAAAKNNEEEEKDIVRYKRYMIQKIPKIPDTKDTESEDRLLTK